MTKLKDMKNEIKVLDIQALIAKTKALKIEINDLILDKNINKLKNSKTISKKRKEMARVLTAMAQKKLIAAFEPKATASAVVPSQGEGTVKDKEKTEKAKKGVSKK
jgi:ribosomal protein L29